MLSLIYYNIIIYIFYTPSPYLPPFGSVLKCTIGSCSNMRKKTHMSVCEGFTVHIYASLSSVSTSTYLDTYNNHIVSQEFLLHNQQTVVLGTAHLKAYISDHQ